MRCEANKSSFRGRRRNGFHDAMVLYHHLPGEMKSTLADEKTLTTYIEKAVGDHYKEMR